MSTISKAASRTSLTKNVGFSQAAEAFIADSWHLVENERDRVTFKLPGSAYDEFKLRATQTHVEVVIPLPNSIVAYCTRFDNYFAASEYILTRFEDYKEVAGSVMEEDTVNSAEN